MNHDDLVRAAIDRQNAKRELAKATERYRAARKELRLAREDMRTAGLQLQRMEERLRHVAQGGELGPRLVPCETGS